MKPAPRLGCMTKLVIAELFRAGEQLPDSEDGRLNKKFTVSELATATGLSERMVVRVLRELEAEGLIVTSMRPEYLANCRVQRRVR